MGREKRVVRKYVLWGYLNGALFCVPNIFCVLEDTVQNLLAKGEVSKVGSEQGSSEGTYCGKKAGERKEKRR